jgi:hypothetical protein
VNDILPGVEKILLVVNHILQLEKYVFDTTIIEENNFSYSYSESKEPLERNVTNIQSKICCLFSALARNTE